MVYELRYDRGHLFGALSGQVLNKILYDGTDWLIGERAVDHATVIREENNTAFSFGTDKLDLSEGQNERVQELRDVEEFAREAEDLTELVKDTMSLSTFGRIGFRVWYLFKVKSSEEGVKSLLRSEVFKIRDNVAKPEEIEESAIVLVFNKPESKVRLSLNVVEQSLRIPPGLYAKARSISHKEKIKQDKVLIEQIKAKKAIENYPLHAVLVDMDFFIEDPPFPSAIRINEFIVERSKYSKTLLNILFPKA
jgi:hypothetical protein